MLGLLAAKLTRMRAMAGSAGWLGDDEGELRWRLCLLRDSGLCDYDTGVVFDSIFFPNTRAWKICPQSCNARPPRGANAQPN